MRILLDESLPRKLKYDFGKGHKVFTVRDKKWLGKKNGDLLQLIVKDKFDLFITVDRSLPYQQNVTKLDVTIVVLCALNNRRETLKLLIPRFFDILSFENSKNIIEIS